MTVELEHSLNSLGAETEARDYYSHGLSDETLPVVCMEITVTVGCYTEAEECGTTGAKMEVQHGQRCGKLSMDQNHRDMYT